MDIVAAKIRERGTLFYRAEERDKIPMLNIAEVDMLRSVL